LAINAAVDSAVRLKKLVDAKLAPIVFKDVPLSARRCSALFGYLNAENRSDKNRIPKDKKQKKTDYIE